MASGSYIRLHRAAAPRQAQARNRPRFAQTSPISIEPLQRYQARDYDDRRTAPPSPTKFETLSTREITPSCTGKWAQHTAKARRKCETPINAAATCAPIRLTCE
jgi:hypothetical protein